MPRLMLMLEFLQRHPWLVTAFGAVVSLWLMYSVLLSDHGLPRYLDESRQLKVLQYDEQQVRAKREQLARRVLLLRDDRAYLESVIHRELGFVYPDEYILIRKDAAASP